MSNNPIELDDLQIQCPDCKSSNAILHVKDGCIECLDCPYIQGRWKFGRDGFGNRYYRIWKHIKKENS